MGRTIQSSHLKCRTSELDDGQTCQTRSMVRDSFSGVPTQNLRAFATCGRLRPCGCVRGVRVRAGVHVFARVCGRARLYGCVRARAPAQSVRHISLLLASQAASGGSCESSARYLAPLSSGRTAPRAGCRAGCTLTLMQRAAASPPVRYGTQAPVRATPALQPVNLVGVVALGVALGVAREQFEQPLRRPRHLHRALQRGPSHKYHSSSSAVKPHHFALLAWY